MSVSPEVDAVVAPPPRGKRGWRIFWLSLLALYNLLFWVSYPQRYTPTEDPDPDGYVTHARGLQEKGGLITHYRLPGYPLFILAADLALPGPIATNVFWVQGFLGWLFGGVVLGLLWRWGGLLAAFTAVLYTAMQTQGSFWGFFTATMMSNFLGSLLALGVAGAFWWLWEHGKGLSALKRGLAIVALLMAILASVVVHPVNYMVLGLLVPAVLGAWLICGLAGFSRRATRAQARERFLPRSGILLWRAILLSTVFLGAATSRNLSYQLFDRPPADYDGVELGLSSRGFSNEWLAHQMLLRLPPARAKLTDEDRGLEAMKNQLSERLGWRVERVAMPPFYPEWGQWRRGEGHKVDVKKLWKARLKSHPGAAMHAAWEEFLHKYHVLLRQTLPASTYWDIFPNNNVNPYPPDDGKMLYQRLFWDYGMDLTHYKHIERTPDKKVWRRVKKELRLLISAVALPLVGFGVALGTSRRPAAFLTGALWMGAYLAALALCGFINGRYFLPFFPFLYLLQCMAVAGAALGLWRGLRWIYGFAVKRLPRKA